MPLLDQYGRPIDLQALRTEQAPVTLSGVRRPYAGMHPAAGLTPTRLGHLLRDSIDGDPERYLALAEDIEERDLHYAGVLGIRKRQVAGLEITVDAATDDARDVEAADLVREVIARDALQDELIDVLDAIGKGFSATEILWDTSEGQWRPKALKWRDPRWFECSREDGETLLLRDLAGPQLLRPYAWIVHAAKAKSGLPIRGGLARAVAWTYLFKAFTGKDWAIFCEAFGQPLRLGKYGPGADDADKDKLLQAVANIGTDFAAIIPEGMTIEFVKAEVSSSLDLYERRCDWLDKQVSKLVLGQVGTTDAVAGGYAVGKVHDGVRADIEQADARQLAATLNRDLVRALIDLNMGPRPAYPRIRIGRPDEVDIDKLVTNVAKLVPLGLRVGMSTMRDKLGLPDPEPDEEMLQPARTPEPPQPAPGDPETPPPAPVPPALRKAAASARPAAPHDAVDDAVADILDGEGWQRLVAPMVAGLQDQLAGAATLDEVRRILADHLATMDTAELTETLARGAFSARLAGRAGDDLS